MHVCVSDAMKGSLLINLFAALQGKHLNIDNHEKLKYTGKAINSLC